MSLTQSLTGRAAAGMFILFSPLAPMGCDEPLEGEPAEVEVAADDGEFAEEGSEALELLVDGESRPERLVAAVRADPDTTLYFVQGDADEDGRFTIDVTIRGRDGGFDYGGLLTSGGATPLELFLAVSDDQAPVPAALERAHDWQVEASRPPGDTLRTLAIADPEPQFAFADVLHTDESTFTCLSWSNFQSYMGSRFPGAPGRVQVLGSAVGTGSVYNPAGNGWWPTSHVDMVACNYKSSDSPGYNDTIDAELCHVRGFGGALTTNCGHGILDDGYYLRRIYGPIYEYRQYRIDVAPLSAAALQSYSGIVKRDA